jgi:uncharacterized membrane protein
MNNNKLRTLVKYAIMIALTTAATMTITIPVPSTNGYFNLGDAMVFLSAILLGRKGGLIAGGIGSALADLLLGFPIWAPFTLIIKGLEGFLAGYVLQTSFGKKHSILALLPAAIWMIFGYTIVKVFLYGWAIAIARIPFCVVQTGFGAIVSNMIGKALLKTKFIKNSTEENYM